MIRTGLCLTEKRGLVQDMHVNMHAVAQWLRHFATNRKVEGSIPDGVTGSFH
jgi:hypothetical protein